VPDRPSFAGETRHRSGQRYNPASVTKHTLYFAYTAFLDPDRLHAVAPDARFAFTAHFPETRLTFVASEDGMGAVPTLVADPGHTVWGGVFEIPDRQVAALTEAEESEGRVAGWEQKAVDREGNKYDCLTFVAKGAPNGDHHPDAAYLGAMVSGARHWSLPAGWVLGLEDLGEDPLFG
jgi:hypothetical protein